MWPFKDKCPPAPIEIKRQKIKVEVGEAKVEYRLNDGITITRILKGSAWRDEYDVDFVNAADLVNEQLNFESDFVVVLDEPDFKKRNFKHCRRKR
jgi:hypothetical protein